VLKDDWDVGSRRGERLGQAHSLPVRLHGKAPGKSWNWGSFAALSFSSKRTVPIQPLPGKWQDSSGAEQQQHLRTRYTPGNITRDPHGCELSTCTRYDLQRPDSRQGRDAQIRPLETLNEIGVDKEPGCALDCSGECWREQSRESGDCLQTCSNSLNQFKLSGGQIDPLEHENWQRNAMAELAPIQETVVGAVAEGLEAQRDENLPQGSINATAESAPLGDALLPCATGARDAEIESAAPSEGAAAGTAGDAATRPKPSRLGSGIDRAPKVDLMHRMIGVSAAPFRRLGRLRSGQHFGARECILGTGRTVSVVTVTTCELHSLERNALMTILEEWPQLAEDLNLSRATMDQGVPSSTTTGVGVHHPAHVIPFLLVVLFFTLWGPIIGWHSPPPVAH
jgi:hypothetical protein